MEPKVLCDEERYDAPARPVGRHDPDNGTKPSHTFGRTRRHKGTGQGISEPATCDPSPQRYSRITFDLVLVLTEIQPTDRIQTEDGDGADCG